MKTDVQNLTFTRLFTSRVTRVDSLHPRWPRPCRSRIFGPWPWKIVTTFTHSMIPINPSPTHTLPFTTGRHWTRQGCTYPRFRQLFGLPVVHAADGTTQKTAEVAAKAEPITPTETIPEAPAKPETTAPAKPEPTAPAKPEVTAPARTIAIAPIQLVSEEDVNKYIANESDKERVKAMFRKDHLGNLHPAMKMVVLGTGQAAGITFLLASFIGARQASEYYKRRHQAAKYETKFKAMRAYYDATLVGSLAHGFKYAFRIGYFTAMFMVISQGIAVYRNKTSFWEYSVAGAVTGASLRISMGLRGMLAAGLLGTVLGTTGGLLMWGMMAGCGETQQDRYYKFIHTRMIEERRLKIIEEDAMKRAIAAQALTT